MAVGSCHDTVVPGPIPRPERPAASASAAAAEPVERDLPAAFVLERDDAGPRRRGPLDERPERRRMFGSWVLGGRRAHAPDRPFGTSRNGTFE